VQGFEKRLNSMTASEEAAAAPTEEKMTPKKEEATEAAVAKIPEGVATLATPDSDEAPKVEIKQPSAAEEGQESIL
jgi:hypothetical protein